MITPFKTRINAKESVGEIQENREIITVPDQTISMREMLARASNGIPLQIPERTPVYNETWTLPDLNILDLNDIQEIRESYKQEIIEKNQFLKDAKAKEKEITEFQAKQAILDSSPQSDE